MAPDLRALAIVAAIIFLPAAALAVDTGAPYFQNPSSAGSCIDVPLTVDVEERCRMNRLEASPRVQGGCVVGYDCVYPSKVGSVAGNSANLTVLSIEPCLEISVVSNISRILEEMKAAEDSGDKAAYDELSRELEKLSLSVEAARARCIAKLPARPSEDPDHLLDTPVAAQIRACDALESRRAKVAYLQGILSDQQKQKYSGVSPEAISATIGQLEAQSAFLGEGCKDLEKAGLGELLMEAVGESTSGAGDILVYYQMRLSEISASNETPSAKAGQFIGLKNETNQLAALLVEKQGQVNVSELRPLVRKISVMQGATEVEGIRVYPKAGSIVFRANGLPTAIRYNLSGIFLDSEGIYAKIDNITLNEGKLFAEGVEIRVLPSQVTRKLGITPKEMRVVPRGEGLAYRLTQEERGKFLWLFPVEYERIIEASAESASVVANNAPWWSVFVVK
ncbi:MAG: hypothetical protein JW727_06250 [Candidatus Aenigmarchaeota archaeon]|nr:hypothetical protein [Candidatus Aenigmarchaeota archaeon]